MNVLQIMRQAQFEIDTIRAGNTTSGMWNAEEVLSAVNVSMDRTARLLRLSGSEILTKTINSVDAGVDLISEIYSPTIRLRILPDTSEYILPPDFVRVAYIRPLATPGTTIGGFEGVRFVPSSYHDDSWVDLRSIPGDELGSVENSNMTYHYVVRGSRVLHLAPTPKDTFDIQLAYHYRPARLRYYSVGTIQRTNGAVGVSGTGTEWLTYGLRTSADLLPLVTTPTGVTLDAHYPRIETIDTDTTLTLARPSTVTDGVGIAYTLAMNPVLPAEHHTWLGQMAAATLLRKVDPDLSTKMQMDLAQQLLEQVVPEVTLRQLQDSLIAQAFELWR